MLLKYVTSYVTKNKDGIDTNSLYSYHVSGGQAAIHYVMDITPAEPEMWLALSSTKISWSSSRTKRYIVPSNKEANEDKTAEKYRNRPENLTNLSFLSWLRMTDHTKQVPKLYKRGNTLVGLKIVSFFNKEFFSKIFSCMSHTDLLMTLDIQITKEYLKVCNGIQLQSITVQISGKTTRKSASFSTIKVIVTRI